MTVLVLSGSVEGRRVSAALRDAGLPVVESFAGRTAATRSLSGPGVRVGGFGGIEGLADYLREEGIAHVIDATHPFAAQMSAHAAAACRLVETPLIRLARPGWGERDDARRWIWVDDHAQACLAARGQDCGRVLLAVGRQHLPAYATLPNVVARVADASALTTPSGWHLIEATGPFTLEAERALLHAEHIKTLVTKDAGGTLAATKLDAAAALGVRVVMIRRPADEPGVTSVPTVEAALAWVGAS